MRKKEVVFLVWKYVGIYLLIAIPMLVFILFSVASKKACINYHGFAVDKNGNIYIGKSTEICVIDTLGNPLGTVRLPTSRGYSFVITENNQILLRAGDNVFTISLQGDMIKTEPISEQLLETVPSIPKKEIITEDGTTYTMRTRFLRTIVQVQKGDNINQIYQMPAFDYVVRIIFLLFLVWSMVAIPITILRVRCLFSHRKP